MSIPKMDRPYITPTEVARILGISYATVMRYIKAGKITGAVRMPYGWRIPTSSVREFIDTHRQT